MSWLNVSELGFADSAALDAFGRLRVSSPTTLFDAQQEYGLDTRIIWDATANGTLAVAASNGSVSSASNAVGPTDANTRLTPLTVSATNGHYAVLQSKQYVRYIPGKSDVTYISGVFKPSSTANVTARFGRFDSANGVFFEYANGTARFVHRTSTSGSVSDANAFAQADWNIDKFLGAGPSGATLDFSKAQILVVDAQMLYAGRVRVGFDVDGRICYAHEFLIANVLTLASVQTYNLPVRAEIRNTAASAGATVQFLCCSVQSEGGAEARGFPWSASNGITTIGVTTRRPVLSIRPKATYNSRTNRAHVDLVDFVVKAATNDCYFELVLGGTLGGGGTAFASVANESVVEVDVGSTTITGGYSFYKGMVTAGAGVVAGVIGSAADIRSPLVLSQIDALTATQTPLSVVCTSFTGTSNVSSAMNWHEQVV